MVNNMEDMCVADTMISILNGDQNFANSIVTTRTAVVTTEASSSAVGGGRPKGATKVASISKSTKIKRCYHLSVEEYKSVRKESKQKVKARLKKGTLICTALMQNEALGVPRETKIKLETIKSRSKIIGGEHNRITASPMIEIKP